MNIQPIHSYGRKRTEKRAEGPNFRPKYAHRAAYMLDPLRFRIYRSNDLEIRTAAADVIRLPYSLQPGARQLP